MSNNGNEPASKKAKLLLTGQTSGASNTAAQSMELVPVGGLPQQAEDGGAAPATSLIPRAYERLSLTINPNYIQLLSADDCLGFERLAAQRTPNLRYYTLNLEVFRTAISNVMNTYLTLKLMEQGKLNAGQIATEVADKTPIVVNACVAALYSKLRTIHKSFGTYATRFNAPAVYNKDIELPLPFADAIHNLGIFSPVGTANHLLCVPVYPEGVQNEGRTTQLWQSYNYESYVPILKSLGIPVRSVDTRLKPGSAWWTYRPQLVNNHFDFRCIFPPSNYSDHSAVLASLFLVYNNANNEPTPLITFLNDDVNYPVRLREVAPGFQLRAFSALCHAPNEEWNQYLLLD